MKLRYMMLAILAALGLAASAHFADWQRFPVFNDSVTTVVEASNKVYCQSGTDLFSYEPGVEECYAYSKINKLSDNAIASVHYNPDGGYLLIAYENCNIDLLYDDGHVANLPELRDAQINNKAINSVSFGSGVIAVSTNFGMVLFDEAKLQVRESGVYNVDITCIAPMGDQLLIYYTNPDKKRNLYAAPLAERHFSIDKFNKIGADHIRQLAPLDDATLLYINSNTGNLGLRTINWEKNTWSSATWLDIFPTQPLRKCKVGWYTADADNLYLIDATGVQAKVALPDALKGQKVAIWDSTDKVWAGDSLGIARYDISGPSATVLYDKLIPANAATVLKVGYMRWSPDGKRLYFSNIVGSQLKAVAMGEFADAYQTTNVLEDGYPRDVSGFDVTANEAFSQKYRKRHGNTRMYGDPIWMVEDPDDSDVYYIANNHEGVYKLRYNPAAGRYEEEGVYNYNNTPMTDNWGSRAQAVDIDKEGNLWICYRFDDQMAVLPADKRKLDPAQVTAADWRACKKMADIKIDALDQMLLLCKRSNMAFTFTSRYDAGLVAIDTKGSYSHPEDDAVVLWKQFTDQDGLVFPVPNYVTFALEDNRGCVWVGTSQGVFEITDPSQATSLDMTVRRIKVPRNDGTNYADYLLESDLINWICLDPSGRKWIATENSGLFLVSETGDKIIRNYNIDNSPLPSNNVLSVECDPEDNTVYVGTPYGLYTLLSDSSAPKEDFSEIHVYPNPVRPEYTGDVTIAGLMGNSVVKIADASGKVVRQMRSEGGMVTWDVCDTAGRRVRSGVYYIFVTSHNDTSTSGSVAKVTVIN